MTTTGEWDGEGAWGASGSRECSSPRPGCWFPWCPVCENTLSCTLKSQQFLLCSFRCILYFNKSYKKQTERKNKRARATDLSPRWEFRPQLWFLSFLYFGTLWLISPLLAKNRKNNPNKMRKHTVKCRFCANSSQNDVSKHPVGCSGLYCCFFPAPQAGPKGTGLSLDLSLRRVCRWELCCPSGMWT